MGDSSVTTDSDVTDRQVRQQHGTAPGGTWYKKQKDMLAAYADGDKQGHLVAWDRVPYMKDGKLCVPRVYGLYASAQDFVRNLLLVDEKKRFGYELIPENAPCKAYADIEWEGPADPDHSTLKRLLKYLRERASELYLQKAPHQWKMYVACGTREAKGAGPGVMKHSYHVVIPNLVFQSNLDMAPLFNVPTDHIEFWWTDRNCKPKCMVDSSVYGRNRIFRTLYSAKRSLDCGVPPILRLKNEREVRPAHPES